MPPEANCLGKESIDFAVTVDPGMPRTVHISFVFNVLYSPLFRRLKEFVSTTTDGRPFSLDVQETFEWGAHYVTVTAHDETTKEVIGESRVDFFIGNLPRNPLHERSALQWGSFQTPVGSPAFRVLVWNPPLQFEHWFLQQHGASCHFPWDYSYNRALLPAADLVFFWMDDVYDLPPHKLPGQLWLGFRTESYITFPGSNYTNALLPQLDLYSSFSLDSDIPLVLLKPFYLRSSFDTLYDLYKANVKVGKPRAVWVASNCNTPNNRVHYVAELMKHFPVDSYGACLNNQNKTKFTQQERYEVSERGGLVQQYMFTLAFENSDEKDYISERVYQAFQKGVIPIYMGAANIRDYVPSDDSIIDTRDFDSAADLAEYLKTVVEDESLFWRHHAWRSEPPPANLMHKVSLGIETWSYRLCHKLLSRHFSQNERNWEENFVSNLDLSWDNLRGSSVL